MRAYQFPVIVLLLCVAQTCPADEKTEAEIGRAVLAIQKAIANPDDPGSLAAVRELGLITAHYPMVRGWLVQELSGAESIRSVQKPDAKISAIDAKIAFLKKAIRAIDLE